MFGTICVCYLFSIIRLLVFYSQCKSHVDNSLTGFRVLPFHILNNKFVSNSARYTYLGRAPNPIYKESFLSQLGRYVYDTVSFVGLPDLEN